MKAKVTATLVRQFALLSIASIQVSCGQRDQGGSSEIALAGKTLPALQGTWHKPCNEERAKGVDISRTIRFSAGRYTEDVTFYKGSCANVDSRHRVEGTYTIPGPARNVFKLSYDGNFSLVPVSPQGTFELDIHFDRYSFLITAGASNQEVREKIVQELLTVCPKEALIVESSAIRVNMDRCQSSQLPRSRFSIFRLEGNALVLGQYMGDLDSFDADGEASKAKRANVIEPGERFQR